MNKDGKPSTWEQPAVLAKRLERLLNNLAVLREDQRTLLESIRGTLADLKSLKASIEKQRAVQGLPGGDGGSPSLALVLQQQHHMTRRESEVAILLSQGASNISIASILGISPHTARHHTQAVLTKLGARSRSEAGARIRR